MTTISVEWVDEIPAVTRESPYDETAEQVRKTGKVAKIVATENSLHTLANRMRERYKDLTVAARTQRPNGAKGEAQYFVYIGPREEQPDEKVAVSSKTTKKGEAK